MRNDDELSFDFGDDELEEAVRLSRIRTEEKGMEETGDVEDDCDGCKI